MHNHHHLASTPRFHRSDEILATLVESKSRISILILLEEDRDEHEAHLGLAGDEAHGDKVSRVVVEQVVYADALGAGA